MTNKIYKVVIILDFVYNSSQVVQFDKAWNRQFYHELAPRDSAIFLTKPAGILAGPASAPGVKPFSISDRWSSEPAIGDMDRPPSYDRPGGH